MSDFATPKLLHAVLLAEFFHATSGVQNFLLAGVERMAQRADFNIHVLANGGAGLELVSTAASNTDFFVIWVGFEFHALNVFRGYRRKGAIINELTELFKAWPYLMRNKFKYSLAIQV